jgi:erythromycin esterase-like protein
MEDADRAPGGALAQTLGHRAIGVVYDPSHERWGNYVPTSLSRRYDAFVFIDQTRALEPYDISFDRQELPETWPRGQ